MRFLLYLIPIGIGLLGLLVACFISAIDRMGAPPNDPDIDKQFRIELVVCSLLGVGLGIWILIELL